LSGLTDLGWTDSWQETRDALEVRGDPARVVRHDGIRVLVADGESVQHVSFPRSMQLAVGDWVVVWNETVQDLLPRTTVLERDHEVRGPQFIATNVDLVLVVFGSDRLLRQSKVMRFVAFAWDIGATPIMVISKVDLADDIASIVAQVAEWLPDIVVLTTSVDSGEGIDELFTVLEGRTGTFIGESGAGKSSLVNALMKDEVAWVGEVRETDAKGRHVTSYRELHLLPGGGMIIDNPGIRSLGLAAEGEGVEALFADIEALAPQCRFRDCAHAAEPGCAIRAAVDDRSIPRSRYESYLRFVGEQGAAQARAHDKSVSAHFRTEAAAARQARKARDGDPLTPGD
jgi:ribosome biogenesis GTPase